MNYLPEDSIHDKINHLFTLLANACNLLDKIYFSSGVESLIISTISSLKSLT
ncbi:hypothetical protein [uncultured Methanobrevibacter sp.]|uniref:hypothetical protein n=1 Tax=uncultured Methanobrevibacter sp. TaxID=253161 RepID=UPI0025F43C01|nr:hypothetical protein [uncultured Methanobrevibacter sp.]